MNKRVVLGVIALGAFLAFGATAFKSSLTPYVAFAEAKSASRAVQIKGAVDRHTVHFNADEKTLTFDLRGDDGAVMPVVFHGVKPGAFDAAQQVVAIGRFRDGAFHSHKLLVKCPSKYQGQDPANHPGTVKAAPGA